LSAFPTARQAFGFPIARAISEYVETLPSGICAHNANTLF